MKKYLICLLGSFAILATPGCAYAARLYLLPLHMNLQKGEEFTTELRLDTQGDSINALDVRVHFPKDTLAFDSASDAASLVNIWVERPGLAEDPEADTLVVSGVAPGGFVGDALIARFTFHSLLSGDAVLKILPESKIVLDGADGQLAFVVFNNALIRISETIPKQEQVALKLTTVGGATTITTALAKTPSAYEDKWFLSFVGQNKSFGIKEFKIRERFLGLFGGQWTAVESPYVLKHQNLLGTIEIQATTNSDTTKQVTVIPYRLEILYGFMLASLFSMGVISLLKKVVHRGLPRIVEKGTL